MDYLIESLSTGNIIAILIAVIILLGAVIVAIGKVMINQVTNKVDEVENAVELIPTQLKDGFEEVNKNISKIHTRLEVLTTDYKNLVDRVQALEMMVRENNNKIQENAINIAKG